MFGAPNRVHVVPHPTFTTDDILEVLVSELHNHTPTIYITITPRHHNTSL